jgi:hypothetical protein
MPLQLACPSLWDGRRNSAQRRRRRTLTRARAPSLRHTPRASGAKNGEKLLRAHLGRTREWCDSESRRAAADAATARDDADLAAALRRHDLSALRKRGFMALCRAWGYRSDVWRDVRVGRAAAATARAEARGAGAAPVRRRPTHMPTPPAPGALALCSPPPSPLGRGGVDGYLSGLLPAPQALPPPPLSHASCSQHAAAARARGGAACARPQPACIALRGRRVVSQCA